MAKRKNKRVKRNLSLAPRKDIMARQSSQRTHYDSNSIINGYNPNEFATRKGFIVIEKMLREAQIASLLELKKSFLLSPGVAFLLEQNPDDPRYQEHLDFIKVNFSKMFKGELMHSLEEVLSAYEYGFSLAEKMHSLDSAEDFSDKVWLEELKFVYPGSVDFYTDEYGEVASVIQR